MDGSGSGLLSATIPELIGRKEGTLEKHQAE
jgi:hypothetical protein